MSFTMMSFSQETLKEKLNQVYSVEKTESILKDAQKKKYYNNVFFNSFSIISVSANKLKPNSFPVLNSIKMRVKNSTLTTDVEVSKIIELIESGKFNILLTDIQRKMGTPLRYRLGNTNKILTIYSYDYLTKLQKKK